MPQMMPLNWILLFTMFSILLISFNMINYFSMSHLHSANPPSKMAFKSLNWKW